MQTCRFCKGWNGEMVKYGVRHHAHHACYLDAGKTLEELYAWQISQFPFRVLADRDLLNRAEQLVKADHRAAPSRSNRRKS